MTAEEFLKTDAIFQDGWDDTRGRGDNWNNKTVEEGLIAFAKLKVTEALEEAAIKAKILEKSNWGKWEDSENEKGNLEEKVSVKINHYGHGDCTYRILTVSHESILKAYPLENIK